MHPNETTLNDYVDRSLGSAERSSVEQHLAACAECRQLVEDLTHLLRATHALEPREAPVRAWPRLERAIRMETQHGAPTAGARGAGTARLPAPSPVDGKGSRSAWLAGLAAAAAPVLATMAGLRFIPTRHLDAP